MTKEPEIAFAKGSGTGICKFTLAVNRRFKKDGQPEADFLQIIQFGKGAEATANYMKKGSQVSISGSIQTRNYENKEGNKVYVTEILADEVNFIDSKNKGDNSSQEQQKNEYSEEITPVDDGDIPF